MALARRIEATAMVVEGAGTLVVVEVAALEAAVEAAVEEAGAA